MLRRIVTLYSAEVATVSGFYSFKDYVGDDERIRMERDSCSIDGHLALIRNWKW